MLARLAKIDGGYDSCAPLIIIVGVSRVFFGIKGPSYYVHNPWFWAKMTAFALVGLSPIAPTMTFLRWRRTARTDASFAPSDDETARSRRFVAAELGLIVVIIACAAAMARIGIF
jgi:putative membrane protein